MFYFVFVFKAGKKEKGTRKKKKKKTTGKLHTETHAQLKTGK